MLKLTGFLTFVLIAIGCTGNTPGDIRTGASQPEKYLPLLQDKKIGLVVNHTSMVGDVHLIDFLLQEGVEVVKILAPEHGFRGTALEGEIVEDGVDKKTGIPVISLYSENRKPSPSHLSDVDVLVFDIQDVGARFYTYISTMHLVMEACAENEKPMLVFDRPNPNGDYIDGPVLEPQHQSFVGMHP
ncbi:MAG: exo-beta-N-acetylmuramidase NamZ domain-containing protein, partial [Mariniphaga sp.]